MNLNELSILSLYSAMAVYALAFISFAFDLAKRSAAVKTADEASGLAALAAVPVGVGAANGAQPARSTATLDAAAPAGKAGAAVSAGTIVNRISARIANDAATPYGRSKSLRIGVSLTVLAWAIHLVADVLRGFAAGGCRGRTCTSSP